MTVSYSTTFSETRSFTVTHARHLASKVATDLMRMHRFYQQPTKDSIDLFERELTALLQHGYLETVTYGFQRNGEWIEPTVQYTAAQLGAAGIDDDPGRVPPGMQIEGASFKSYLTYSRSWHALSQEEQDKFEASLPFQRTGAPEPTVAKGRYFQNDKTYSSGSVSLGRSSIRSY